MPLIALGLLFLLGLSAPSDIAAEVFRCKQDGGWVYTDQPCRAHAPEHELPEIGTMPSSGADKEHDLARAHDRSREASEKERDLKNQLFLETHRARRVESEQIETAIQEGRVLLDMSPAQVRRALGPADYLERDGDREGWFYRRGRPGKGLKHVVWFKDRRVVRQTGARR